jgi:steroid delta-isomerase-like uncharacterized protein
MSIEEIKTLVRFFYENSVEAVLAKADELIAPHFVYHTLEGDLDREGYKQVNAAALAAFPDLDYTLDDLIVEDDKAVERWTMTGTHQADFNGIPATNKAFVLKGVSVDRLHDGKVVETWMFYDSMSLLKQLGLMS